MIALLAALLLQVAAPAAAAPPPPAVPPAVPLAAPARTLRRYSSTARQGVAVGPADLYAVSNWELVRYDKQTGEKRAEWTGDKTRFPHINSCAVIDRELVCASSNFPGVPQVSTVEVFDPVTLAHRRSVALGLGTGSITWVDRKDGFWWAMFANYDGKGGEPPRDHRHTTLVKFDAEWRRLEAWALPASILARIAPMSVSGGGWARTGGSTSAATTCQSSMWSSCRPAAASSTTSRPSPWRPRARRSTGTRPPPEPSTASPAARARSWP